ncbi:MAG: ABC transporter ATP-binding protein [Calditrichaceae bacterium]|nr:ABC transporter ATP-binding protein [Calditrichia bacterium]NUQ40658.1 ABC transporter ATP-binding protein [Calditrichaceae bacterium]
MNLIYVENLIKEYHSGEESVAAVDNISFSIDLGEFVAVVGPSGSGKSTLLTVLGGLTHPTGGQVVIDEIDVYALTAEQRADFRKEYIGFVFQSFHLIPYLNVLENVMIPLAVVDAPGAEKTEIALGLLEKVSLADKARRLPDELSGGEQERVAIARALVNNPPIILADEPTGNLDSTTSHSIMALFRHLNEEGQSIVMVTHNPENLTYAGRFITLRDGKIAQNSEALKQPLIERIPINN